MEVQLLRWPEEARRRFALREARRPRLLLIAELDVPPPVEDCLEDWVRVPASDEDLRARLTGLLNRSRDHQVDSPSIDEDGTLHFAGRTLNLPPIEQRIVAVLAGSYESVVRREAVFAAAWPEDPPARNVLDVHLVKLRRKIAPLGLRIRTVRSRGYMLDRLDSDGARTESSTG